MPVPRLKRIRLASIVVCATLLGFAQFEATPGAASTEQDRDASATSTKQQSRVTSISVAGSQSAGTFGGVPYHRIWGTVSGIVAPGDAILSFDQLPHDADGNYDYLSEFEIIEPAKPGTNSVILVEAENRGTPVLLNTLHNIAESGPPSKTTNGGNPGNGFLFEHATSYARVQWQTGVAAGVP